MGCNRRPRSEVISLYVSQDGTITSRMDETPTDFKENLSPQARHSITQVKRKNDDAIPRVQPSANGAIS